MRLQHEPTNSYVIDGLPRQSPTYTILPTIHVVSLEYHEAKISPLDESSAMCFMLFTNNRRRPSGARPWRTTDSKEHYLISAGKDGFGGVVRTS